MGDAEKPFRLDRLCASMAPLPALALALSANAGLAQDEVDEQFQSSGETPEPLAPDEGRLMLDRDEAERELEQDAVAVERCEDEADVARVAGEIVVCRDLGEATDGFWNKADFERRYAAATQGPKPVFQDAGGLQFPGEGSLATITVTVSNVCVIPPCASEAALLIDVASLPEAPPGSDADRIARGLPPLGRDPIGDEMIRRREDLGLPTSQYSVADEE